MKNVLQGFAQLNNMPNEIIIEESKVVQSEEYIKAERDYCKKEIDVYSEAKKALQNKRQEFYIKWMKEGEH